VDPLYEVFGDPVAMHHWSSPPLMDEAAANALLREIHDCFSRGDLYQGGVALADTDRVIGAVTLAGIARPHRRAGVGFALATSAWGQGYATEAVTRLSEHAFVDLEAHRLEADVDPRNEPSLRLLEQLGFRREGLLRERYHLAGEVQDSVMLGLLRAEWMVRHLDGPA